jgi:hypothetical protein
MSDANFRCSSISTVSSVVPYTLIDLLPNLNTCYSRLPPRACNIDICPPSFLPSFESFHSFINFPLTHIGITTPNCRSPVSFTTFRTLWPQESNRRSLFLFFAFCQWSSYVQRVTVLSLLKKRNTHWCKWWGGSCWLYPSSFSLQPK